MSCGCENDYIDCGCSPCDQGFSPVVCTDPETCEETYSADCILYPNESLKCSPEADSLFGTIDHYLVPDNPDIGDRRMSTVLSRIELQLCFATNRLFLKHLLEAIDADDELKALYCQAVCNCSC